MVSRKLEENIYKKRIDDLFNEWKNNMMMQLRMIQYL